MSNRLFGVLLAAVMALAPGAQPVRAEEPVPPPALMLELNSMQTTESGCRMTFVISNDLEADIDGAAFEIALFDSNGLVDRLTVIEFASLPSGRTKVSRFDFPDTGCEGISRVLVNDVAACRGASVSADICARRLSTTTRSEIEFGS